MDTGKMIRRAAALCVAAAMLSGGALADAVTVTAERLNVRTEPSAKSKAVTVVSRGQTLQYVSEADQWILVALGGKQGYVLKEYVSVDPEEIAADVAASRTVWTDTVAGRALSRVNMRALPVTASDIEKVIGKNDIVTLTGECGDWYIASYGGRTGYVLKEYIITGKEAQAGETAYAEALAGVASTRVNMRAGAEKDAAVLTVLARGAALSVIGESGEWYRVSTADATGYVMRQYVTLTGNAPSPDPTPTPAPTNNGDYASPVAATVSERVNMRASASADAAIVKVIAKGASVSVTGESGGWYKVTASGRSGYIYSQYVTLNGQPATPAPVATADPNVETAYAASVIATATARVNMRASASANAAIVKVIGLNDKVNVAGEKGDWYKVSYDGRTGYVMKAYIALSSAVENASYESWTGVADVEVNMRKAPEGDVMYVLKAGTELTVTGRNGSWYLVNYRGSVGYVASSYVSKKGVSVSAAPAATATASPAAGGKGYVSGGAVNIRSGAGTEYGVATVARLGDELTLYEQTDGWYRVSYGGTTGYISAKYVSSTKPDTTSVPDTTGDVTIGRVISSDWWTGTISTVFKRGMTGTVTDVDTRLSFQIKRTGGTNHLDAQPLTSADTAIMYKIYGYQWQWTRRAIWVTVNGVTYAASMNGMPHGESDSMPDNNFDGCFCIHFTNSRTHAGNRLDAAHQAAVQKALRAGNS
ncbi:MAG: SH3 domain-containing protein [Clostridia bacterium]|nr:SH3 domain-containing protein [Clostridia bacterium]